MALRSALPSCSLSASSFSLFRCSPASFHFLSLPCPRFPRLFLQPTFFFFLSTYTSPTASPRVSWAFALALATLDVTLERGERRPRCGQHRNCHQPKTPRRTTSSRRRRGASNRRVSTAVGAAVKLPGRARSNSNIEPIVQECRDRIRRLSPLVQECWRCWWRRQRGRFERTGRGHSTITTPIADSNVKYSALEVKQRGPSENNN